MLTDPAGLTHRIPELEPLASVPSVRKALASGKPHKVYRAIWWARLLRRFKPSQRATADTLLAHRRLWLEPIDKAPSMHTVNGVGTAIYGKGELQDDGTAIGTHFIVFVFMPIFPLAQYLYINHGNQYRFYGKAPLGPVAYGFRNLVAMGTGVAILGAGWGAYDSAVHADLTVVNGTDADVRVQVGEAERRVPAQERRRLEGLPIDADEVVILLEDGTEVERGAVSLSSAWDENIWNIGGQALIFREEIPYTAPGYDPTPSEPTMYCGQRFIQLDADYRFRDPPEQISMPEDQNVKWKSHVDWIPGGSWMCVGVLLAEGNYEAALPLTLAGLDPTDHMSVELALLAHLQVEGPEASADWVDGLLSEHDTVAIHRARQNLALAHGDADALAEEYLDRMRADDADSVYLASRLLPPERAVPQLRAGLDAAPDHGWMLWSLAWNHAAQGDYQRAAELYASDIAFQVGDPSFNLAEALAGEGDLVGALTVFQSRDPAGMNELIAEAQVLNRLGRDWQEANVSELGGSALDMAFQYIRVHGEMPEQLKFALFDDKPVIEVVLSLMSDPNKARSRAKRLDELGPLGADTMLILYGDALYVGDDELVQRIEDELDMGLLGPTALAVARGDDRHASNLPLQTRAAAHLAYALHAEDPGPPLEQARREDVFGGLVHHVADARGL